MRVEFPKKKLIIFSFGISAFFFLLSLFISLSNSGVTNFLNVLINSFLNIIPLLINALVNLGVMLYFHKKTTTNKVKHRNQYLLWSYGLCFIAYFITIIAFAYIKHAELSYNKLIFSVFVSILVNTLILALQSVVIIQEEEMFAKIENSELKVANANAANQLLREQIHPHFLFNALTVMRSLYKFDTKQGEEYLIRLSNFLRASISNNNIKVISLNDELKICSDYLEMQKMRFGKALICDVSINVEKLQTGFVPSFSIQPLLENAIKHNELTEAHPLCIRIYQEEDRIIVTNPLRSKSFSETSTGSGLANLSERYRLLSDDKIIIENTNNTFSVSIKILNREYSNN